MVEKPRPEDAPSNLIISGRYILQPEVFTLLADQPRGAGVFFALFKGGQAINPAPWLQGR